MLKKSKNARFKPYQNFQSIDTDVQSSAPRRSLSAAKRKSTSEAQLDEHKVTNDMLKKAYKLGMSLSSLGKT